MTPEQLAEIKNRPIDSLSADADYNADAWTLANDRDALLAEVERLARKLADTEAHLADACREAREAADVRDKAQAQVERLTKELAKPKGGEVLDWAAECEVEGHPDWYLHSENWPSERSACPTCAIEAAAAEVERLRGIASRLADEAYADVGADIQAGGPGGEAVVPARELVEAFSLDVGDSEAAIRRKAAPWVRLSGQRVTVTDKDGTLTGRLIGVSVAMITVWTEQGSCSVPTENVTSVAPCEPEAGGERP